MMCNTTPYHHSHCDHKMATNRLLVFDQNTQLHTKRVVTKWHLVFSVFPRITCIPVQTSQVQAQATIPFAIVAAKSFSNICCSVLTSCPLKYNGSQNFGAVQAFTSCTLSSCTTLQVIQSIPDISNSDISNYCLYQTIVNPLEIPCKIIALHTLSLPFITTFDISNAAPCCTPARALLRTEPRSLLVSSEVFMPMK